MTSARPCVSRTRARLRRGAAALAAVGCLAACSSSSGSDGSAELVGKQVAVTSDPSAGSSVATAEQAFSLKLLRRLGDGTTNTSVSPASLALVLSMLENGAAGTTRTQIAHVLQTGAMSPTRQDAGWQALTDAWSRVAKQDSTTLSAANSVWLQKGFTVRSGYLDTLRSYFDAGVWTTDFDGHPSASLDAINSWTSDHTGGRITKLFDSLDPGTLLALADAVYFKAAWDTPFDPQSTEDEQFTLPSGSTATTSFLQDGNAYDPVDVTKDYTAVQLPYQGGHFAALVLMPTSSSLKDFSASLTTDELASIVGSLGQQSIALSLPKFTTSTTSHLNDALGAMGMPQAFTSEADFSALTAKSVSVGQVVQRVYLKVAEKGTEATAASGADLRPTAVPARGTPVMIDHPFLFLIRDTTTGAILFASQITDPAAS